MKNNKIFISTVFICFIILIIAISIVVIKQKNDTLINTYRDTKLLFQIKYPQNWVITEYVDYERNNGCVVYKEEGAISDKYGQDISESCGEGTSLIIATHPTPYPSWSIDNPPPNNYLGIGMSILLKGSAYQDNYQNEENVIQREKHEIDISNGNKLTIIVYDYKNDSGIQDMSLPTAIAYYYGDNYLYEFNLPRWEPNTEAELNIFEQIVSTFKEIK